MTIPNEILLAIIPLFVGAVGTIWHAWRKAEQECLALRDKQIADAKAAYDLLTEQRIANVGALSTIAMREFERDAHKDRADRCERDIERMRDGPTKRQG